MRASGLAEKASVSSAISFEGRRKELSRSHVCDPRNAVPFVAGFLAKTVKISNFLHGSQVLSDGAPEEIRTPDPQIRNLPQPRPCPSL